MQPRPVRAKPLIALFFILLLNSSYLAATAEPSIFYLANILLHLALGLALAWAASSLIIRQRPQLARPVQLGLILLLLSALFGVILIYTGAARSYRWLLQLHIITAVAGAGTLVGYLCYHARTVLARPSLVKLYTGLALITVLLPLGAQSYARFNGSRYRIVNPPTPPSSMEEEGGGPQSPFFPSSARTNVGGTIPANFFMTSEACARCHKDIYDQWNSSAHHFASFNNQWYRKSIEYMQDVIGTQPSKWCAGCHDHAVFFNGRFDKPIKEQINTPEAQNGLGCTSCHAIVHVGSSMGNGDFTIEYPALHDLAASKNPWLERLHDFLVNLDPAPHKGIFLKDFHRQDTAEFCASCHKVHLDKPVNNYRWVRGFNDYDNWQASGVSGQGARSFYYPPKSQKCADCHMPLVPSNDPAAKDGKVKSHRFPGANTAIPFVNNDQTQLKVVEEFLKDGVVSIDLFGLSRAEPLSPVSIKQARPGDEPEQQTNFAVGEEALSLGGPTYLSAPVEVIGPLDKVPVTVRRGDSVRLEVVVRTRKMGHFFPGGTVDAFDVWVELQAVDETGRVIFWSGQVEDGGQGPVERGAHFYRSLLLDEHGNVINKRNAWAARSTAYVRLIPPGAADTVHYRLNIPPESGNKIYLKAKVNHRKFSWWNTQWAYAGVPGPGAVGPGFDDRPWSFTGDTSNVSGALKAIPNLPIVTMAEASAVLTVIDKGAPLPEQAPYLDQSVRERWNDYGIGLLLQGDIKGAEAAFLKVTQMEPEYVDGWVNVGRARLQEGQMTAAQEVLRKALELAPNLARTNFFYGLTLKAQGHYEEALKYLRVAATQYPRDRVVRNQVGRVLFLQRKYQEAIVELQSVLAVDPEDLQAHYNLMLCYQGLGQTELAKREEVLYRRFKADEAAQAITGPFRKLNPADNNERQQIHEHHSIALGQVASYPWGLNKAKRADPVASRPVQVRSAPAQLNRLIFRYKTK